MKDKDKVVEIRDLSELREIAESMPDGTVLSVRIKEDDDDGKEE